MCFGLIVKPQLPCLLVVCLEYDLRIFQILQYILQIFSIFVSNVKMCQKYKKLYSCCTRLLKWETNSVVFEAYPMDNIFNDS